MIRATTRGTGFAVLRAHLARPLERDGGTLEAAPRDGHRTVTTFRLPVSAPR